jgi:transposase
VLAAARDRHSARLRINAVFDQLANLIKIVFWDGTGLCLFTKRLEQGVFLWPPDVDPGETLALSSEQLSMLIDGVDWRAPERRWRPAVAG